MAVTKVIDYQKLNKVTKKDSYPLPHIDDALDCLGGAKYFSAMDLISGYWQKDLPPEEQEKCAIITSTGLYQPTRMTPRFMQRSCYFSTGHGQHPI